MAGKNIKLKDGTGAEIDYTGVPKIKIPAADGGSDVIFQLPPTMQKKSVSITSNGTTDVIPDRGYDGLSKVTITTNVAGGGGGGGADVSNWGDAEGEGSYIYWPNNSGITAYGKGFTLSGGNDFCYAVLLNSLITITGGSVKSVLDTWAANVMTSGTAENTAFNNAFNSEGKSLFLGKYLCNKPEFLSTDKKNLIGLRQALSRSLGDLPRYLNGWWSAPAIADYLKTYDTGDYYESAKQTVGFWWKLPSSTGVTELYSKLQTPIGLNATMPAYEGGMSIGELNGVEGGCAFVNQNAAGSGNTSEFVMLAISGLIVLYSPASQTIPASLINMLFQVEQELSVEAGWSYINVPNFTATSTTIDYLTDPSLSDYGLYLGNMPYSVTAGMIDEYQLLFFSTSFRDSYIPTNYTWGFELNIVKSEDE